MHRRPPTSAITLTNNRALIRLAITQIPKITVNQTQNAPCFTLQFLHFSVFDIFLVMADVEIINQFLQRAARAEETPNLAGKVIAPVTFGDVICERDRRSSALAGEVTLFEIGYLSRYRVHFLP